MIEVTNIGELMEAIKYIKKKHNGGTMWYRGHGNRSWSTVPSVQRNDGYCEALERQLVNRFRIRAAQILENAPAKNDYSAWMSLMQHYGLATRLMDWSKSPLIAAYFATEKDEEQDDGTGYADACIWILWPSILNRDQIETDYIYPMDSRTVEEMLAKAFKSQPQTWEYVEKRREKQRERNRERLYRQEWIFDPGEFQPVGYGRIVACEPVEHNLRMYSQQACFTVHDTIEKENGKTVPTLKGIAKELNKSNDRVTTRVIIPHRAKETFREELAMLGITKSFIYPDMDHLSTDIKRELLK